MEVGHTVRAPAVRSGWPPHGAPREWRRHPVVHGPRGAPTLLDRHTPCTIAKEKSL
jgi:hypothetical protein